MKRKYSKPEILFENFALCQSIASGCTYTVGAIPALYEMGCGIDLSDRKKNDIVFLTVMSCDIKEDDGEYNNICYHTFENSDLVLFGS